jgi:hypothetical protein
MNSANTLTLEMRQLKLLDYYYGYDYGHDFYAIIGQFNKFNLFDATIHTTEYWSWEPNLQLTLSLFDGRVFSLNFSILSLTVYMNFLSYRCPMDLTHTRK